VLGRIRGLAVIMLKLHPSGTYAIDKHFCPLSLDKHCHIMHWMPFCFTAFPANASLNGFTG